MSEVLSRHRCGVLSLALLAGLSALAMPVQAAKPLWAVPQADESPLQDLNLPWFDGEKGAVEVVPLEPPRSSGVRHRDSTWLPDPKKGQASAQAKSTGAGTGTSTGAGAGTLLSELVSWLFWILLGLLGLAGVLGLAWMLLRQERRPASDDDWPDWDQALRPDATKIEALPFEVAGKRRDFLSLAREAQERGELRDATIFLFSYWLLKLDQHGWIELARGKTNRVYVRELRGSPELQLQLQRLVEVFEDVFFGDLPVTAETFEARWQQLDRFHQLVATREVAA